jgi:hypothetical protein
MHDKEFNRFFNIVTGLITGVWVMIGLFWLTVIVGLLMWIF